MRHSIDTPNRFSRPHFCTAISLKRKERRAKKKTNIWTNLILSWLWVTGYIAFHRRTNSSTKTKLGQCDRRRLSLSLVYSFLWTSSRFSSPFFLCFLHFLFLARPSTSSRPSQIVWHKKVSLFRFVHARDTEFHFIYTLRYASDFDGSQHNWPTASEFGTADEKIAWMSNEWTWIFHGTQHNATVARLQQSTLDTKNNCFHIICWLKSTMLFLTAVINNYARCLWGSEQ